MVFVVIPVFNREAYTRTCLLHLAEQSVPDLHIIVVDDGSSDGTTEMLQGFPDVEVIHGSGDWYWTGSVYKGVARALELSGSGDDFIFILNDDLEFGADLLKRLIAQSMRNPNMIIQALGSWTDRPDIIQFAGLKYNRWTAKREYIHEGSRLDAFPEDTMIESAALTGRGVLFPIKVFRMIGNYDRRIVHRGDPELTQRALKAGWKLVVYFGAVVYSIPVKGAGNVNERQRYRISDIGNYYFGILSSSHIPTLWRNARAYSFSFFQSLVLFSCMFVRHTWHFFKKLQVGPRR